MSTAWIVTKTNPELIEIFHADGWEVKSFRPADFMPEDQSPFVPEPDVIIYDAGEEPPSNTFRQICNLKTTPLLAILANWDFAWRAIETGADDVSVGLADPIEVTIRARKLARASKIVHVGVVAIDLVPCREKLGNQVIRLSPIEFRLLAYLAEHIGEAVNYDDLLDSVWDCGAESGGTLEQVKTGVRRLRQKVEPDPHNPQYIISIKKVGYRLRNQ